MDDRVARTEHEPKGRTNRGRPEAPDVAQQHAFAPFAVEGRAPSLVACSRCRQPKLPHVACTVCGTYNDRQVVKV